MAIENNPDELMKKILSSTEMLKNISGGLRSLESKLLSIQDATYIGLLSVSKGEIKPELFIIGLVATFNKMREIEEDITQMINDVDNILNGEES